MKIKNTFPEKVVLIGLLMQLLFFNNCIYSQIIYTDIPDATPNATYPLDLNNDTIVDFLIQFGGSADSVGIICYPQNNNAYSGDFVNGSYLPWALSSSNTICDSLATWYDYTNPGTMGLGASLGFWPGVTNKYLALKLIVGTNTYFGWARFDFMTTSTSFTIKDYAYESTPNACIQSGQTTLGNVENSNMETFSISPNPFTSSTTIYTMGNLNNAIITLYNSFGQALNQVPTFSGQTVFLSRENLSNGLYFISLTEENKIIAVEKLIITD